MVESGTWGFAPCNITVEAFSHRAVRVSFSFPTTAPVAYSIVQLSTSAAFLGNESMLYNTTDTVVVASDLNEGTPVYVRVAAVPASVPDEVLTTQLPLLWSSWPCCSCADAAFNASCSLAPQHVIPARPVIGKLVCVLGVFLRCDGVGLLCFSQRPLSRRVSRSREAAAPL